MADTLQSNVNASGTQEEWTEVISDKRGLFDLKLDELWKYRDLIVLFVKRDFVAQYKQTILGPLWHFIQPLLTTFMFLIVFNKIANISTEGTPPTLFYMASVTLWNYFAVCLNKTSTTFVANAAVFGKVYFPRLAVPVATVISSLLQFAVQFMLLTAIYILFLFLGADLRPTWWLLTIPYFVFLMAVLSLGLGVLISSLTTKYRDLTVLITFGVQLLMYASAVPYPLSSIPEKYQALLLLNPIVPVIEGFRYALFGTGTFNVVMLGYTTVFCVGVLALGIVVFNKIERSFMDTV